MITDFAGSADKLPVLLMSTSPGIGHYHFAGKKCDKGTLEARIPRIRVRAVRHAHVSADRQKKSRRKLVAVRRHWTDHVPAKPFPLRSVRTPELISRYYLSPGSGAHADHLSILEEDTSNGHKVWRNTAETGRSDAWADLTLLRVTGLSWVWVLPPLCITQGWEITELL
jgi:hypothetical protein